MFGLVIFRVVEAGLLACVPLVLVFFFVAFSKPHATVASSIGGLWGLLFFKASGWLSIFGVATLISAINAFDAINDADRVTAAMYDAANTDVLVPAGNIAWGWAALWCLIVSVGLAVYLHSKSNAGSTGSHTTH